MAMPPAIAMAIAINPKAITMVIAINTKAIQLAVTSKKSPTVSSVS